MNPEPTILELLEVAEQAVKGSGDNTADFARGSDFESLTGPSAIVWSRQARRDTDLFDAIRFHGASGDVLTEMGRRRYGIERYVATRGTGTATFARPTAGAGAGTIWKGTRIARLAGPTGDPKFYRVTEDRFVGATDTLAVDVPVEALTFGPGSAVVAMDRLRIEDPLWDSTWTIPILSCSDGEELESAADYRDRVRQTRREARVGQVDGIIKTCKAQGAGQVVCFPSDYGGEALDAGLNVVYVGDLGYTGTANLVRACVVALRSVRVGGDCLQVLPMARVTLPIEVDIYLRDTPSTLPIARLEQVHRASLLRSLGGNDGGFEFSRKAAAGEIIRHSSDVQRVSFVNPTTDLTVLQAGAFPTTLNRYVAAPSDITIRYH